MTRRRGFEAVDPAGTGEDVRILLLDSRTVELDGGGVQHYRGGDYYIVPPELARKWEDEDAAYPDGRPPACPACGQVSDAARYEGDVYVGPRAALARHVAGNHPELAETPPPPTTSEGSATLSGEEH
jgi:hypothetical protein